MFRASQCWAVSPFVQRWIVEMLEEIDAWPAHRFATVPPDNNKRRLMALH